jgi:hypothetical protein
MPGSTTLQGDFAVSKLDLLVGWRGAGQYGMPQMAGYSPKNSRNVVSRDEHHVVQTENKQGSARFDACSREA